MRLNSTLARQQRGVALIEALVSVLIFAIGILALLGLQTLGVKAASDGKYRADAAYLANQLVSQMWSDDRNNVPNYTYNSSCTSAATCSLVCGTSATNSTATLNILQSWRDQMYLKLPGYNAQVQVFTNPPSLWQVSATYTVAVSICWRMPGDATGQYHQYVTSAQIS